MSRLGSSVETDGKFNNFTVGFLSVALNDVDADPGNHRGFGQENQASPVEGPGATEAAIEKWMETHFP